MKNGVKKFMSEIECKYLLCENAKSYTNEDFNEKFCTLDNLINETMDNGVEIEQGYLDIKYAQDIMKILKLKLDFMPYELRVRKMTQDDADKYFITFKSDGTLKREEKELTISQQDYDTWYELTEGKRILKKRLTKNINGLNYEFDVYTDRGLIVCEVEVGDESMVDKIIPFGLDITANKIYKNRNLAK